MPAKHPIIEGFDNQLITENKSTLDWGDTAYFLSLLAIIVATENIHKSITRV